LLVEHIHRREIFALGIGAFDGMAIVFPALSENLTDGAF
jgi:hypothetical protein